MKEVINMSNNDQEFLVQKIRTQYTEKQHTELDALKELDASNLLHERLSPVKRLRDVL